jgi:diacylglycerol kinase family enzyme
VRYSSRVLEGPRGAEKTFLKNFRIVAAGTCGTSEMFVVSVLWLTLGSMFVAVFLGIVLISFFLNNLNPGRKIQSKEPSIFEKASQYRPEKRLEFDFNILILCSPHSGNGSAVDILDRIVRPMLRSVGIHVDLVFLEKGSQAYETAVELAGSKHEYQAIGILGGDKVLHEIIQGFASESLNELLCVPFLLVPCGTKNGLAFSLGLTDPFIATETFIESLLHNKFNGKPVDLYQVKKGDVSIYDAYLTSWGIQADISLEVERGPLWIPRNFRTFLATIKCLVTFKSKKGTIKLKVQNVSLAELENLPDLAQPEIKLVTMLGEFVSVTVSNVSRFESSQPDNGRLHVSVIRHCSRYHALRSLLAAGNITSEAECPWITNYVVSEITINNETGEIDVCGFGEEEFSGEKSEQEIHIKTIPRALRIFY